MKVLLVCDDIWHPSEVIEKGLEALRDPRFTFDIVKAAKDILTPERIAAYPVILCCKGDSVNASNTAPWFEEGVTEVGPGQLEDYVRAGGGFISLHACNTAGPQSPMSAFIGNVFLGHPPRCAVDIKVSAAHPVTVGIRDFRIRDEHYQIQLVADDATVLLHSESPAGGRQPACYVRHLGQGRLCALTPGHTLDVWENAPFQRLLTNALLWCARVQEAVPGRV